MNETKKIGKNQLAFIAFAGALGAVVGAISWLFLKIMDIGLTFLWETLPSYWNFAYYPILVCTLGGILIGLCQKKFGAYPEELDKVISQVKTTHRYEYKHLPGLSISALLPLMLGGSIGPEAGLTGLISGLCTWVGDRFQHVAAEMKELTAIGLSATLGTFFCMPLFGFVAPIENDNEGIVIPNRAKMILSFAAIFGGLGSYMLLKELLGGGMSLGHLGAATAGEKELLFFLPLALFGTITAWFYYFSGRIIDLFFKPMQGLTVLRASLGGMLLGISGFFLPFAMFSGESQSVILINNWLSMSAFTLILTGFIKLVIINVCLQSGWRGGNIFPLIFTGICLGYGLAHITGIDAVFAVIAVTASLCGAVMRKPLAVTLVLLLCFPAKSIIPICAAAFIGATIPLPQIFREKH